MKFYNEHIQSRLLKDYKSFHEANLDKAEDQRVYSYERANSSNEGIRQLGFSRNGLSSLDLFRELITHIGMDIQISNKNTKIEFQWKFITILIVL